MGRFDPSWGGRIHLVQNTQDVAALTVRDPQRLAFVTQTTLSVDDTSEIVAALRARFPQLATPRHEDICYATQNRQDAVKKLLEQCDVLLVVGSRTSSNSNRLRELADRAGIPGYLVDGPDDLRPEWFDRQAGGGCYGGRLGTGGHGAAGDRAADALGRAAAARGGGPRGARAVRAAARAAPQVRRTRLARGGRWPSGTRGERRGRAPTRRAAARRDCGRRTSSASSACATTASRAGRRGSAAPPGARSAR